MLRKNKTSKRKPKKKHFNWRVRKGTIVTDWTIPTASVGLPDRSWPEDGELDKGLHVKK